MCRTVTDTYNYHSIPTHLFTYKLDPVIFEPPCTCCRMSAYISKTPMY